MNKFLEAIHDMIEIITGEKPKEPKPKKRKRSRKNDWTFRGDDISTPNVNEAWEDN